MSSVARKQKKAVKNELFLLHLDVPILAENF